jgi:CRP/FNR family transcriptional regulator
MPASDQLRLSSLRRVVSGEEKASRESTMPAAHLPSVIAPLQYIGRQPSPATDGSRAPWKTLCSTCHLRDFCLPSGLKGEDVERLDDLHFARRSVRMGQVLYRQGEKFPVHLRRAQRHLQVAHDAQGRARAGHRLPDGRRDCWASTAWPPASTPAAPSPWKTRRSAPSPTPPERTGARSPDLQQAISRIMSREIVREHSLMMLLGSMNAEERLAAFLLNISQRMKARGYSASEFHLRMSRAEIGSYLGMKVETVSRTFSAFVHQHMLDVDKRHVRITDLAALQQAFDKRVQ